MASRIIEALRNLGTSIRNSNFGLPNGNKEELLRGDGSIPTGTVVKEPTPTKLDWQGLKKRVSQDLNRPRL